MKLDTSQAWTLIIRPRRPWLDLRLGELWQVRDLILLFVRRDFVAVYKQTILGPLWFLVQPLLTTLTFTVIFGRVARLPSDGLPPFLFYLSGTVMWSYFAACLTKTSGTFIANAGLFGKVYFPRLAVPISILLSNLVAFGIQLCLFLVFVVFFWAMGVEVRPNAAMLLLPVLLFLMAGLGLGLGIIVASLTTRYRDLQHLVSFGAQLLMYATPVIYPVSAIPEGYRPWIQANPLAPIVEAFRYAFLGTGTVSLGSLLYSAGCMLAVLLIGLVLFNRIEQTFMTAMLHGLINPLKLKMLKPGIFTMTLEEIKQQYPNQWVLIECPALDENLDPVNGTVIAHSESHDGILAALEKHGGKQIVIKYMGDDLPVDFTYAL